MIRLRLIIACVIIICFLTASMSMNEARVNAVKSQIRVFETALEVYKLEIGSYPTEQQGLLALLENPGVEGWNGPYWNQKQLPKDPWGNQYRYHLIDGNPVVDSAGPDEIFGTKDDNGKNLRKSRQFSCAVVTHQRDKNAQTLRVLKTLRVFGHFLGRRS